MHVRNVARQIENRTENFQIGPWLAAQSFIKRKLAALTQNVQCTELAMVNEEKEIFNSNWWLDDSNPFVQTHFFIQYRTIN